MYLLMGLALEVLDQKILYPFLAVWCVLSGFAVKPASREGGGEGGGGQEEEIKAHRGYKQSFQDSAAAAANPIGLFHIK